MLHRAFPIAAVAIAALSTAACSSSAPSEAAHIRGTVAGLSTQNGRAVAVTSQGKSYWAALDKTGTFDLALPAGAHARVYVVSAPAVGRHPVAGHLVGVGASKWIFTSSGTTQLGALRPATVAPSATGVTTKSEASGADDASEQEDGTDDDTHEDDGEKGNLCGADGSTDVELHADSAPAASADTDDKEDKDREDEESRKGCGG